MKKLENSYCTQIQSKGKTVYDAPIRIVNKHDLKNYGITCAYNVKKDLPFHKNGIMHLFEGSCRFHQKDQICDAA